MLHCLGQKRGFVDLEKKIQEREKEGRSEGRNPNSEEKGRRLFRAIGAIVSKFRLTNIEKTREKTNSKEDGNLRSDDRNPNREPVEQLRSPRGGFVTLNLDFNREPKKVHRVLFLIISITLRKLFLA